MGTLLHRVSVLCVLPVIHRLWASLRFTHLREWVESFVPQCVFSLWNGVSSVEAWFSTALDIEKVCLALATISRMSWSFMVLSPLTRLTGPYLTLHLVALGCLPGSERFTLLFVIRSGCGLSWMLAWVSLVARMDTSHRDAR